jgi:hypothetical protein
MTDVNAQRQTLQQLFNTAINIRQHEITNMVYESSRGIVQGGPFRGMRLVRQSSWGAGEICPKLLGCYEAELVPQVAEAIAKSFPLVINVGCAEGYYAIGLARRLPKSKVIAYDVSDKAQAICRANTEANGVADRVEIRGVCTPNDLTADLATGQPAFLLMDCEGAEINLLKPETVSGLEHCDILVECHDLFNPQITPSLLDRFAPTHTVERIEEGARNPNFPMLRKLDSVNRWIAVCEFRMQPQHWLMFRSKKLN